MKNRILPDLAATNALGRELGESACPGMVIGLTGDLGSGKTHLCKAIVAGLGSEDEVTSPTFSLVHEYRGGRLPIFHLDFYRIESAVELIQLGWDEILDENGVVLVEWADKFPDVLPPQTRWVEISAPTHGMRTVVMR